jgi:DNA helicase-2/ATP-dependent DNA helicase PcrA
MNFNDLIFNTITLLNTFKYKPKWIIVDEFQDSDYMQLEFIKTFVDTKTKIFAVGDPNQIIYSWRGGNHNVFSLFKDEYGAKELSLPINYRSCSTILEVAKCFLSTDSDLSGFREQGSKDYNQEPL